MRISSPATPPRGGLRSRGLLLIAALVITAFACSLLNPPQSASPAESVDLSVAADILSEAGVSLQDALTTESEDQRAQVLDLMGAPDAFSVEWQELDGGLVRWEEWSYFDFESRFDFVDGELLWTLDIAPAPDGSFYAHAFDPLDFHPELSPADAKAMFPDLPFMEIPLEEADIPAGLLLATDQLLLGFSQDRLVFAQSLILSPDTPPVYETQAAADDPASTEIDSQGSLSVPILHDSFDDPSQSAGPLFGSDDMEFSLYDGIGSLIAHDPGELIALYDATLLSDFVATLELWPADPQPDAGYGLVFRSDDRGGGLTHYYAVTIQPADRLVRVDRWNAGSMIELARAALPDLQGRSFELAVLTRGAVIEVGVNGQHLLQVTDSAIPGPGLIGLVMHSPVDGDSVLFDELTVEALDE